MIVAKEVKSKKSSLDKQESPKEIKENKDVSYFNSVGIDRVGRSFRVVLSRMGSDGSFEILEEFKAEGRGDALETFKLWAVNKIYDNVIKDS